jgi:hypothetical protein
MVSSLDLPWHYLPLWFFATTPNFLIVIFLISFFLLTYQTIKRIIKEKQLGFLSCFLGYQVVLFLAPFIMVIAFKSVVYDGWRHVFFVASPFIIIIALGLNSFFNEAKFSNYKTVFQLLFLLPIAYLIFWNVKNHPYQNVYFNRVITSNYDIRKSFELDYWGVSFKQGLEKIAMIEKNETIKFNANCFPGYLNLFTLKTNKTFLYKDLNDKPDYFLSNYRWHPQDYPYKKIDSIMVDGYEIMGIYKVK